MIKTIKVSNVAYLSYQMHFDAKIKRKTSTTIKDVNLYNMMLINSDDTADSSFMVFPFSLLSYLGTEYFVDICLSVSNEKINSEIFIEFYYFNSIEKDYDFITYHLIFNKNGITKEMLNDIDIRTKESGKFATELPQEICNYFNNFFSFNFLNDIQVNKYFEISSSMIREFDTFKHFTIDFFKYLGYTVSDIFFDNDQELNIKFAYTSNNISAEEDKELKIIISLCSVLFTVFIKTGTVYLSNLHEMLPQESLVRVFELMSISDAFMLHNNCQFVLEESNKIINFIDNSEFLYKPIVEDVQILKVTEFLNTFFVEWKKN
jgi:hypothetical protein